MAFIERVALPEPEMTEIEVASVTPGLRIQSRSTTSSLSDYALYDLKTLLRDEERRALSDGMGG